MHTFEQTEITLSISDGSGTVSTTAVQTDDKLKAEAKCHRATADKRRFYVEAFWDWYNITGVQASITTHDMHLCDEETAPARYTAKSNVHAAVQRTVEGDPEYPAHWAQTGYSKHRFAGSTAFTYARYVETRSGPGHGDLYDLRHFDGVPTGPHTYRCQLNQVTGAWEYIFDGTRLTWSEATTWPNWKNQGGDRATWTAEIFNKEDQVAGTSCARCIFKDCRYWIGSDEHTADFVQSQLSNDDAAKWEIQLDNPQGDPPRSDTFKIWDKVPDE